MQPVRERQNTKFHKQGLQHPKNRSSEMEGQTNINSWRVSKYKYKSFDKIIRKVVALLKCRIMFRTYLHF